jgi:hypothetical protein
MCVNIRVYPVKNTELRRCRRQPALGTRLALKKTNSAFGEAKNFDFSPAILIVLSSRLGTKRQKFTYTGAASKVEN